MDIQLFEKLRRIDEVVATDYLLRYGKDVDEAAVKETTTYTTPFWRYLIHDTDSEENRRNILEHGFEYSSNPNILKGIYTQPDDWYISTGKGFPIKIYTRKNTRIFDNGVDRPMDSLRGLGNIEFNKVYVDILNKLGYKVSYAKKDGDYIWFHENEKVIEEFIGRPANWDSRQKYQRLLYEFLIDNNYDVYINGGEIIIVNEVCIDKLEKI